MYVEVKGIAFRTMSFEVRMEGFSIQFAGEVVQLRGIIDCIILFSTSMLERQKTRMEQCWNRFVCFMLFMFGTIHLSRHMNHQHHASSDATVCCSCILQQLKCTL